MAFATILRSSALMGGASVLVLVAGFFRAKIIAVWIGPEGVGLAGNLVNYNTIVAMLAGWGLSTSGVRLIAQASPTESPSKIAAVWNLGRRLVIYGGVAALILSVPVAWLTFQGNENHAGEMLLASLGVPLLMIAGIGGGILQAKGNLKALARTQVQAAFAGLLLGLPLIYFLKQTGYPAYGVAASILVAMGVPALLIYRAIRQEVTSPAGPVNSADAELLIKLGGALMLVSVMSQLSAYVSRVVVIRELGLTAAGHYQAALAIASSLPGFVFAAMATDFFPRVSAAPTEDEAQHLVEKQIQAGLLLALPCLAVLLSMGRLCIHTLYATKNFEPAIPLLTWMVWGVFLRLVSWPIGFWLQARGSSTQVIVIELISNLILAGLPIGLIHYFGLLGAAEAYAGGYLAYALLMFVILRWRTGRWLSWTTFGFIILSALALVVSQACAVYLPGDFWGLVPSGLIALASASIYYSTVKKERKG